MKLYARFKRLTLWNKVFVFGTIASILGLLSPLIPYSVKLLSSPDLPIKTDTIRLQSPPQEPAPKELAEGSRGQSRFKTILESDYNDEVLNAKEPVLVHVDTWYDTACQVMEPFLEIIAKEYEGKVKFIRLDYDTNMELATSLGSYSNSLIIIYVKGKERKRFLGAASQKAITTMIDSVLNPPADRRSQSK